MDKIFNKSLPGWIAACFLLLTTSFWVYWGTSEMFYEGWWGVWYRRLVYLIPGVICLLFTIIAIRFPKVGGWILIVGGASFSFWWWGSSILNGEFTFSRFISQFPLCALLVITGTLFLLESRYQKIKTDKPIVRNWWLCNLRMLICVGLPVIIGLIIILVNLPGMLARVDDGIRSARVIQGNGVNLVWAPQGPGWNWKQEWGGYPSWNSIARYGVEPVGIDKSTDDGTPATSQDMGSTSVCTYLSEDGVTLMDEPQFIWRMPTVDELVRSLVYRGENAGCTWNGSNGQAECKLKSDKETPLWAPDEAPIYYWAADEVVDSENAYYVSFNGWVKTQPKDWGNPRHGYRCVKEQ